MNKSVNTAALSTVELHPVELQPLELQPQTFPDVLDPTDKALQIAWVAAQTADDRKAADIQVVQVTAVSYLADYFVVASGFSPIQVKAIARAIEGAVEQQCERSLLRQEGLREGRWVLQDYGDVVVHIFMPQEREYYDLEAFWGHGQVLDWQAMDLSTALSRNL